MGVAVRLAAGIALAWLVVHACPANACDVPVYRYALERWAPGPYHAMVFHKGPLSDAEKGIVDRLRRAADGEMAANIDVTLVDLSRPFSAELQAIWKANPGTSLPWAVVLYPSEAGIRAPAWAGPLSAPELSHLLHSPKRQEIVRQLGQGSAAVYLILESGNRVGDAAAEQKVRECLRKAEAELAPATQADAPAAQGEDDAGAKLAPVRFTTERLSRTDPAERLFVRQLLGTDPSLARVTEPILFPIFGQGRMLCALHGKQVSETNLQDVAAFLVGDCSCEVKQQNPGVDLLMTANWYAVLAGQPGEGPTLPSLATLPATASRGASTPAAGPAKRARPAARPARHAKTPLRIGRRVKPKVGIAGAAARLRAQRAAEAREAKARARRIAAKVSPGTKGAAVAKLPPGVKPGAAPATTARAAMAATASRPGAPGPGTPAAAPAGRRDAAAGKQSGTPLAGKATPPGGRPPLTQVPALPAQADAAPAPAAPTGGEAQPASNTRLIASAGIALLLGLALAALAPRILLKRARGPRRPA